MKFHFEYKPVAFKKYVNETFTKVNLLPYPDYDKEAFKNSVERLRGQVDINLHAPIEEFENWLTQLEVKYKQLLPFVYEMLVSDEQRGLTIIEMQRILSEKKVVLAHLLHQCYIDNNFTPYWALLVRGYKMNPERYNKYWTAEIKRAWAEYVDVNTDHVAYVGKKILERNNIEAVMDLYFVREEHAFYRELFIYIFEHGNMELYKREEKRFTETFKAADNLLAQRLASGFIKAGAMDELENVTYTIFGKLNTYVRRPMYWSETEQDVKERFHQWFLRKNIKEFFAGVSQNHERFIYWEKFIPRMKDALVLGDRKTILFYFPDVVIMEILGTGAVYIYEVDVFESHFGEKVKRYREGLESDGDKRYNISPYRLERRVIMDRDLVYKNGWLMHSGDWQRKFDNYLRKSLRWEV